MWGVTRRSTVFVVLFLRGARAAGDGSADANHTIRGRAACKVTGRSVARACITKPEWVQTIYEQAMRAASPSNVPAQIVPKRGVSPLQAAKLTIFF